MVANIRLRLLDARFSGVTLNCDNFLDRHGAGAFPLTGASVRFYGMSRGRLARRPNERENLVAPSKNSRGIWASAIKSTAKRLPFVPILWQCLRVSLRIPREIRHCVKGFVFLRTQDLLVVSGGGQLNEEYGGAWAHPFTLFKWAVLARMARVPYVVASVGAGKVTSRTSRMFVSAALRAACYRSYRDKHSREIAAGLLGRRAVDVVVPDLAFSLPPTELPKPTAIRAISQQRTVIAISPIVFAKSGKWPTEDDVLHDRYLTEMAEVLSQLLRRDCFLVMACSSLFDDESVIPQLFERLDDESKKRLAGQIHIPIISSWKDFVATLRDVDLLIASRLHSTILGFISEIPTVAISFDPKVEWLMQKSLTKPTICCRSRTSPRRM